MDGTFTTLALSPDVRDAMKAVGLSPVFIDLGLRVDWAERDAAFKALALPGKLDFCIPSTDLPLWKVISLDRLSFWYGGAMQDRVIEFVGSLEFDRAIVSFDLGQPGLWFLDRFDLAEYTAVGVGRIRSRSLLDYMPALPFSQFVVNHESDARFLGRHECPCPVVWIPWPTRVMPPKVEKAEREKVRRALKITNESFVSVVRFEGLTEWAFRRWLDKRSSTIDGRVILVVAEGPRDRAIADVICQSYRRKIDLILVDSWSVEPAADEVVCFRHDQDFIESRRVKVSVMDVMDRFLSSRIADDK